LKYILKVIDPTLSGGDNWTTGAISHAKLQLNHHHQQTNIQLEYILSTMYEY